VEGAGHVRAARSLELGTRNGGVAIWARKRLEQLDHEVREGEANVTVWFAWLVAAQRR
jgi:hypothetical protein